MYNISLPYLMLVCTLACIAHPIQAKDSNDENFDALFSLSVEQLLEVPVEVGSRGESRQWKLLPVPVDVLTAAKLQSTGLTDLNLALRKLLPYFNHQQLNIRDGSDHTRPSTLRGMSPDQVLVLVNGKRFHPGALTHLSVATGKGANHVDLSYFPISAIERIEILKDGAAAQYGSDAIAGIINIVLAKNTPNQLTLNTGSTFSGDGAHWSIEGNGTLTFKQDSFIQATASLKQIDKTIRAGSDIRQQYFDGDPRNDLSPSVKMHSGSPDATQWTVTLTGEHSLPNNTLYGFANLVERDSEAAGFFRRPLDNRTLRSRYPDGFLPKINAEISDLSFTLGITDTTSEQWLYDLSNTYGENRFHYFVVDSANVSMGDASPSDFDAGELRFIQNTVNLDWSVNPSKKINDKLSFGLEHRFEQYQIIAGEPASYIHGGIDVLDGPNVGSTTQAGAQVFPGFKPDNALKVNHNSYAGYVDYEYELSLQTLLQGALRVEYHDDFGSTFDYKLATRHSFTDKLYLRSSISSGFRAPSLAQQNFTSTALSFIDNKLVNLGTFAVDAPISQALGSKPLKPEQSKHFSMGLSVHASDNLLVELDLFHIEIEDRIGLSGNISQNNDTFSDEVVSILQSFDVANARFFTNAIDSHTQGLDFAVRFSQVFDDGHNLNMSLNYHYNQTKLVGDIKIPGPLGNNPEVIFNRSEANRITARQPNNNLMLALQYQFASTDLNLRVMRYGSVHAIFNNSRPQDDQTMSAKWLVDVDIKVLLAADWSVNIGVHNLFDTFPDYDRTFGDNPFYGRDRIFQYSDSSPFGINGGSWYLRTQYRF